jgi:uncharacterized protein (DUF305 family)
VHDAKIRLLAEALVKAHEGAIAMMRAWLAETEKRWSVEPKGRRPA